MVIAAALLSCRRSGLRQTHLIELEDKFPRCWPCRDHNCLYASGITAANGCEVNVEFLPFVSHSNRFFAWDLAQVDTKELDAIAPLIAIDPEV